MNHRALGMQPWESPLGTSLGHGHPAVMLAQSLGQVREPYSLRQWVVASGPWNGVHPDPDPAVGAAKANAAGPLRGHAVADGVLHFTRERDTNILY